MAYGSKTSTKVALMLLKLQDRSVACHSLQMYLPALPRLEAEQRLPTITVIMVIMINE